MARGRGTRLSHSKTAPETQTPAWPQGQALRVLAGCGGCEAVVVRQGGMQAPPVSSNNSTQAGQPLFPKPQAPSRPLPRLSPTLPPTWVCGAEDPEEENHSAVLTSQPRQTQPLPGACPLCLGCQRHPRVTLAQISSGRRCPQDTQDWKPRQKARSPLSAPSWYWRQSNFCGNSADKRGPTFWAALCPTILLSPLSNVRGVPEVWTGCPEN